MSVIGQAFIAVDPETENFSSSLEGKLRGIFSSVPVLGAIAGLGVTVGGVLLHIGDSFEHLNNTIIQKTGASGAALQGLEGSAKKVFSSTLGATFQNVGDTISELSVRTHLTGSALDSLAQKEIELGKITHSDVGTNVQQTTALFDLFGVSAKNQSGELDVLFKASQQSGVGFQTLIGQMQTAAPVAQILGLNVNQTAALVANLTAAGLPASKVMMGLSSEFQKAAKAGKDPTTVINDMVTQLKAAPSATAAATIAIKDFGIGSRQAATLVDAVRSGALNLGTTLASITNGQGGIVATANATATISDKLKLLKNQAETALAPIAAKFLDLVTILVDHIEPAFSALTSIIGPVFKTISGYIFDFMDGFKTGDSASSLGLHGFIGTLVDLGNTVRNIFGDIRQAWEGFVNGFKTGDSAAADGMHGILGTFEDLGVKARPIFEWIRDNIKPILIAVGAAFLLVTSPVTLLIAGLVVLYVKFQVVRDIVAALAGFFVNDLIPAFASLVGFIISALEPLVQTFVSKFGEIESIVKAVVEVVAAIIYINFKTIELFWSVFHATILRVLIAVWDEIKLVITTAINIISDVIKLVLDVLTGHWSNAWNDILNILQNIWNLIGGTISNALSIIGNLIGSLGGIFLRAMDAALGFVVSEGLKILQWFEALPLNILKALGSLIGQMVSIGGQIIQGLINGIIGAAGHLVNAVTGVLKKIPGVAQVMGLFGSPSPLFHGIGGYIMQGLANGINENAGLATAAMGKVAKSFGAFTLPNLAPGAGGSNSAAAASGLGGGGAAGGVTVNQHIHPSKGMSEAQVGKISAAEISWQSRPLRSGGR